MPFTVAAFNKELLLDDPTYERFLRSDLHKLVEILRRTPPDWTASTIADEMKRISRAKWRKYARTRAYLEQEIPTLTALLRAIPTGFTTIRMQSQMGDTILRHSFKWTSDTGNMEDLAQVFTRESVTWPQWPQALTDCIGPAHLEYKVAGSHYGLAANPANVGHGQDDHALIGPFDQTILKYTGVQQTAPMDQVYQYSYDRINWLPIADSSYTIVREVTALPDQHVQLKITKTNTAKPRDTFSVKKTF